VTWNHYPAPQGVTDRTRRWRRVRRLLHSHSGHWPVRMHRARFRRPQGCDDGIQFRVPPLAGIPNRCVIIGGFVTVLFVDAILRFRRKGDNIPRRLSITCQRVIYTVVPIPVSSVFFRPRSSSKQEVANPEYGRRERVPVGWKFTDPHTETSSSARRPRPTMVIQVNTNVHINLTSTDVITALREAFNLAHALPACSPVHARSGQDRKLLRQCTQLCGLYIHLCSSREVVSKSQYTAWLASTATPSFAPLKNDGSTDATQVPTKPASSHGKTNG